MPVRRSTALVTGASGGIGLELARLLVRDDYDVVLVARSELALHELASDFASRACGPPLSPQISPIRTGRSRSSTGSATAPAKSTSWSTTPGSGGSARSPRPT